MLKDKFERSYFHNKVQANSCCPECRKNYRSMKKTEDLVGEKWTEDMKKQFTEKAIRKADNHMDTWEVQRRHDFSPL